VPALSRLGVIGWPVAHSRSPAIQNAALAAAGLPNWTYQRLPVPAELFAETARALPAAGFRGANVTIPHKAAALAVAARATDRARAIGAANTLTFAGDGPIAADNTDAPGLIAALPEDPAAARALVLGAGGSARAAVWALREAGAAEVLVWNRTAARSAALAAELGARAVAAPVGADLLVHCTAAGLAPAGDAFAELPIAPDDLAAYGCVVDLVYGEEETALVAASRARGVRVVDGLDVLVAQGALSFELWTGRPAPVAAMLAAARA
jgi:shikimate dehydrogenase